MNYRVAVLFSCVFTTIINQVAHADKEDKSDETADAQMSKGLSQDSNATMEEGPPDSHEAMNNRELKSKLTISGREKRSYEFLMGLVNNNSRFQVTNVEDDTKRTRKDKVTLSDLGASELLLEMIVKIAAHPGQWEQVHNLLQKIDSDIVASKKIVDEIENSAATVTDDKNELKNTQNNIELNKKETKTMKSEEHPNEFTDITKETVDFHSAVSKNYSNDVDRLVENSGESDASKIKNVTQNAVKTNSWPFQQFDSRNLNVKDEMKTTKYPWKTQTKSMKSTYPRNFAYHRVTGNPLYHSNVNKNPKAYIAVSVIAPKPLNTRANSEDLVLENELRELKPWTHNQNLKNMANIRSRWVIQSDQTKPPYTP